MPNREASWVLLISSPCSAMGTAIQIARNYVERDQLLQALGFTSYPEYLASALWRGIRDRRMMLFGGKCRFCYEKAVECHHVEYSLPVLRGEEVDAIVPLCRDCHYTVEFDLAGHKRTLMDSLNTYRIKAIFSRVVKCTGSCHGCGKRVLRGHVYCRDCYRKVF